MNILKIDTTKKEKTIVELVKTKRKITLVKSQKFGSQVLLPMIAEILEKGKINIGEISAIEVNEGPGSFTGTRIGVAVANIFAKFLKVPINGKKDKMIVPIYDKSKFDI